MNERGPRSSFPIVRSDRLRLPVLVACLTVLFVISRGTGSVIVDGFQSIGAVAGASGPGRLSWPMLGDFLGYDQTWGFHWIGWPMLRSLLLPLLPWSPGLDLGLCFIIWGATSWMLGRLVEREDAPHAATLVGITCVLSPVFLVAAQSYRPEILTALALVVTLGLWNETSCLKRVVRFIMCVILPTLHPLGLVVPGAWCGYDFLRSSRASGFPASLRRAVLQVLPLVLGGGLLASWFLMQPLAGEQFRLNLDSQRMLIDGLGTGYATFFRWGLGSIGALPMILLLAVSAGASLWFLIDSFRSREAPQAGLILHASVALISALAFNILAKNPNILHMVAVLPFAAWLFVSATGKVWKRFFKAGLIVPVGLAWLVFVALPAKQGISLARSGGSSHRNAIATALKSLPPARQVLVPVAMWEASMEAGRTSKTIYRFSTFPNLLASAPRSQYESRLLSETRPGDLLIWDGLQDRGGIFNFVTATALRHQVIRPSEDPTSWERLPDLPVEVVYSKSQPSVFEVYRKR